MNTSRTAPRKARASQGASNCIYVGVQRMTATGTGYGYQALIEAHSDLPGLERFRLLATPAEWRVFCDAVKAGEFDLDSDDLLPGVPVTIGRS